MTNLLVHSGLDSNSLEIALRSNAAEYSTIIEIAKLGKNILRHYCRMKREKGYMH